MNQTGRPDKNKTRWKPVGDDIFHILQEHKIWLESDGQQGHRAEIYNADLSGADLYQADLRSAQIWDTSLHNADLREADLTGSEGIKPENLAGADLSGARLPDDIKQFDSLDEIEKHSKKSRKIFIGTLILLHFAWIMLIGISDANLLSRVYLLPSLRPELYIPSFWFFTILPILIFGFYIALHLNLQRNWEKIAELPAVFPDDIAVDKKIYRWHTNKLILPHLKLLKTEIRFSRKLINFLTIFSIRWAVPQTLVWFWLRYLTRHDWGLTIFHVFIVTLSILFAFFFQFLTRRTLRGKSLKGSNVFLRFGYLLVMFAFFFTVSLGVIQAVPQDYQNSSFTIAPKIAAFISYDLFLDFSDGEISKKPADWTDQFNDFSEVEGADLKDFYAPNSKGQKAFLVNADLSYANLKNSNLDSSDLRGANLTGAKLNHSSLVGTNLEGANLTGVHFDGVNLLGANLNNVTGLTIQALHKTDNWLYDRYG